MNYLNYQYCLSDFVIADNYEIEYLAPASSFDFHYQTMLENINNSNQGVSMQSQQLIRRVYASAAEVKAYISETKTFRSYNPLVHAPEMYLELNKLVLFDEKSLMKFLKNYGIAHNLTTMDREELIVDSTLFQKNDNEKFLVEMDVIMFYEKVVQFKNLIRMWNDIKTNNVEALKNIKNEFEAISTFHDKNEEIFTDHLSAKDYLEFVLTDLAVFYQGHETRQVLKDPNILINVKKKATELKNSWKKVKDSGDLQKIAFSYLNLKLKEIDSGVTATRFMNDKIVPAMKFNNLLEVAGYQLKQAIFKDYKLEECINCGALFEPKHASQKFCSPLPDRKRSTCENTYNQRLKRTRLKEKRKLEGK